MSLPGVSGVRTARKLLIAFGVGLGFVGICSVGALVYLRELNTSVRHLAFDPVPGAAAIASFAKDFNQYRTLEVLSAPSAPARAQWLAAKASDIARDLTAYGDTITQDDDRARFKELVALWTAYAATSETSAGHKTAAEIDALLFTMIDWNRLEGVRTIVKTDSAARTVSATVLAMLVAVLLMSALAFYLNRAVERPMNALGETAHRVALGNLQVRAKVEGPPEVAAVAHELNEMLDARARADAEARTLTAALEESREQLQRLTAGLLLAREDERTKIAREIHDVLGQTLTALKMDVAWIGRRLPDDGSTTQGKLAAMSTLIDETVVTVRRIATELRPGILDDLGLAAAVEWQAEEFEGRIGIACALTIRVDDGTLDPLISTAVFRILQEALTNVARHSRASAVTVTLEQRDGQLILGVSDNGIGVAAASAASVRSIGLAGMRERTQLVDGRFSISGAPGAGTTVRAQIPWREKVSA